MSVSLTKAYARTTHTITIDETRDGSDIAYAAFCEGCAWAGPWHHAGNYPSVSVALDEAEEWAERDGAEHLAHIRAEEEAHAWATYAARR